MVSKNNSYQKLCQDADRVPHYGLRKLSVGVASVLLSTTLYLGVNAQADTTVETSPQPTISQPASISAETPASDAPPASTQVASSTNTTPNATAENDTTVTPDANSAVPTNSEARSNAVQPASTAAVPNSSANDDLKPSASPINPATLVTNLTMVPTNSNELVAGKDFTINDVSFQETNDKFTEPAEILDLSLHFDNPTAAAGKYIKIQAARPWEVGWERTVNNLGDKAKLSFNGQEVGDIAPLGDGLAVKFNDKVSQLKTMDLKTSIPMIAYGAPRTGYRLVNYLWSSTKHDKYTLTNDWSIGGSQLSSGYKAEVRLSTNSVYSLNKIHDSTHVNVPYVYHFRVLSTPTGETYITKDSLNSFAISLWVGTDVVPIDTENASVVFSADPKSIAYKKLSFPWDHYDNTTINYNKSNLVPGTTDIYYDLPNQTQTTVKTVDAIIEGDRVTLNKVGNIPIASADYRSTKYSLNTNVVSANVKLNANIEDQLSEILTAKIREAIKEAPNSSFYDIPTDVNPGVSFTVTAQNGESKTVNAPNLHLSVSHDYKITPPAGAILISATNKTINVYQPDEENIPSVVDRDQLTKTVTRTINVHKPGEPVQTIKQTVILHQSASVIDGTEVHYNGDWTPEGDGNWQSYTVPTVSGYTASQSKVAQKIVTNTTKDQTVDITYTANAQSLIVKYVDDEASGAQVGTTQTLRGSTGSKVTTNIKAPTNYVLSGTYPAEYTFTDTANQQLVVHLKHAKQSVNDQKTVTRTVNYTDPKTNQTKLVERQTATLNRTGTKDLVTNNTNWNAWSTSQLKAVSAPSVAGYQVTNGNVAGAMTVNDQSKDTTVTFTYTANAQTTHVKYVDKDNPRDVIHTTNVSGKTDQTVNVPSEVPAGWQLVSGQSLPKNVTFTATGYPDTTVKIEHKHTTVTPDQPKTPSDKLPDNPTKSFPAGVGQNDLNKTITRTINVTDPHTQKVTTTNQPVHLTRTADVDEVSGAVTYGKWTTGEWPTFNAPAVAGYTPSQASVAKTTVTDTTKDQTVKITYTANPQSTTVNYVDQSGKAIHTTPVKGITDQTVKVPSEVPAGWKLVDGQTVPKEVTFGPDGYPAVTVKIEHGHVTVTPDKPKTPSDKLPDNPTKPYPSGVSQNDLNKTITRTIQVVDPHTQKVATTTQSVHLTRTADVDEVSGAVTYGQWTTGTWQQFTPSAVPGYTPTRALVDQTTVTDTTQDQTVKITYTANAQTTQVNYVDKAGQVIHTTPIKGVTDQTVKVPNEVPAGWKLVDGQTVPSDLTFGPDGYPAVTVKIEHRHVTVTPDQPKTPADAFPDNPAEHYPTGVAKDDLNKTITRKINVTDPHTQKVTTTTQTVHLTRTADVDEVNGAVVYGKWTTGTWDSFIPSPVAGYTPSVKAVNAVTVVDTTADQTVSITYTANPQTTQIEYVAPDDQIVHTTPIAGTTDQTVDVPNELPAGWSLSDGQTIPTHLTFGPDGHPVVKVLIEHGHVTVTPDSPKTPSDTLPDNPAAHYPTGVGADDLNKTITRTINVTDPHTQKVTTTTQTVHLTRTADVDEVTGDVEYSDWTTGEWAAFTTPKVAGYTPSVSQVAKITVTDQTKDTTVDIKYTANSHSTTVNYVDGNGEVVHATKLTGTTDQTISVPNEVPAGWQLVGDEVIPTELTFTPNGYPDTTVKIEHSHVTVTPDSPKTPSDTLPNNPSKPYPSGVAKDDLNKTITRTINVVDPHTQKMTTTTQIVHLTRTADIDEVTGDVKYSDWTTGEWAIFQVPTIAGYTPSASQVTKVAVTDQTKDTTVTIKYTANTQSTTVNYVDGDGTVVHTTKLTGTTDQTIPVPNEVPAGWQLVDNETIPTELTFTPNGYPTITVKVEHHHVTVTPNNPKTPSDTLPNNPTKPYPSGVAKDDLNKTITRTINVVDPHTQKVATTTQTVHLIRTADVDEVTGDVEYGAWTTGNWAAFTTPTVAGYTPSTPQVAATKVTAQTPDATVTITYTADTQSTVVNYVDGNGDIVHTTKLTGTTDETIPVPNEVPAGWQLVGNETIPTEITFTPDGYPTLTVKVQHSHVTVTPDQPKTPSDTLPNNPTKHYPTGLATDDLNKTITRTINVVDPHTQKVTTTTQSVHLIRTADVDQVTGDVEYSAWTTGNWAAFTAPAVAGYTPAVPEVAAMTVDAQTKDAIITITYTADQHTTHVNYVAGDGTVIHTTTLTGHTDETVTVPNELPAGWKLVDGQTIPDHLTMTATGHADLNVSISHAQTTVTPDAPKTPADMLPDNPTKGYPTGVAKNDLNKTVIRTINLINPINGHTTTIKQTATLTRSATVDEVTGAITYSAWSTDHWPAFQVPDIEGYQPSQGTVAKTTVEGTTLDQTVTITYQAQEQTIHVVLIDGDQILDDIPLTGPTGFKVQIPLTSVDQGKYEIVGDVPSEHVMVANDDTIITVHLTHRTQTTIETRTITRTINLTLPGGTTVTIPQVATLERTRTTDLATGQVTYGPWSTAHWDAYHAPSQAGYTATPADISDKVVTADMQDQTITIVYRVTAKPQTTKSVAPEMTTPVAPVASKPTTQQQLPQTGDDEQTAMLLAGLALGTAQLSLLGIQNRKKQRN